MTALPICPHCLGTGFSPHIPDPIFRLDGAVFGHLEGLALRALVDAAGGFVSSAKVGLACYGHDFDEHRHSHMTWVRIMQIRKKLATAGSAKRIEHWRGFGYRLVDGNDQKEKE